MVRTKPHAEASNGADAAEREEVLIFHEHIRKSGLKRTAQRDLILDVFLRTEAHVSSEDLYELVKLEDPTIGFTTVYRTLKLLQECGLARNVQYYDGRMLYEHDFKHDHHDHLICTTCGALIEFYSEVIENMQDEIAARHKFRPESHSLRIFGTCHDCQVAGSKAKAKSRG
jgi:Fur family transcriptional regulator, ferric uptake regulator